MRTIAAVVLTMLLSLPLLAQDDALSSVARLFGEARYAEAADAMDSAPGGTPEANWWRARLTTDPARFQELALRVIQDGSVDPGLKREATLVAPTNDEEGVAWTLEELGLG